MSEDRINEKVNVVENGEMQRSDGFSTCHDASEDCCPTPDALQPVVYDSLSAGYDTQQGGDHGTMEGSITLGSATYAVSRHFSTEDHAASKRELLRSLLIQKMERQACVDREGSHGV